MYSRDAVGGLALPRTASDEDDIELASLATSNDGNARDDADSAGSRDSFSPRDSLSSQDPFDFEDPDDDDGGILPSVPLSRPPPRRSRALAAAAGNASDQTTTKTIRFRNGLGLCIGLQIGSGIFSTPGLVASVGSPGAALFVWSLAGGLAWMGAASFAELGAAIPLNGGTHAYMRVIYGDLPAFLFSWTGIICLKPGSAAIIATVTAEYIVALVTGQRTTSIGGWQKFVTDIIAIACLVVVSGLVALGSRTATKVNDVFMLIKIGALLAVFGLGLAQTALGLGLDALWKAPFQGTSTSSAVWAVALLGALWPYDGWDNCSYVANEMVDPKRDIPRVVHTAQPIVTAAYVLANVAYFAVLPLTELRETHAVGLVFGRQVLGSVGATSLALAVVCSSMGALLSQTFTTARLVAASADAGEIPVLFGDIHPRFKSPVNALAMQLVISSCYVLVGNFEKLVTFTGVASWSFYFVTTVGVLVLRRQQPLLDRPYQVPMAFPIAFAVVAAWLVVTTTLSQPIEAGAGYAFLFLGVPAFYIRFGTGSMSSALRRWRDRAAGWVRPARWRADQDRENGGAGDGRMQEMRMDRAVVI